MLLRRGVISTRRPAGPLLFYAPLTHNLLPAVAWDGNKTLYESLDFRIEDGAAYCDTKDGSLIYNSAIPPDKSDLTFSCWCKANVGASPISYGFGAATKNRERHKGCQFCNDPYPLQTEWLLLSGSSDMQIKLGEWAFFTFTIRKTAAGWNMKIYKDGMKVYDKDTVSSDWLAWQDCFYAISHGVNNAWVGGSFRHFSCFDTLTDEEVMALYNNGGIPA